MTPRLLACSALLALLMICAIGCRDVNQAMKGRQLTCERTPEDVCIRVADFVDVWLRELQTPTITGMTVSPRMCDANEIGDAICFWVNAAYLDGETDAGVHQHADGTLGRHHTSNGAPPDT
jgi:hypothetical protein